MDKLFKEQSVKIRLYFGKETEIDPYERNVEVTMCNPIPIRAIVTDLTMTKANYAMQGVSVDKAKEILIYKKYKNMLEMSQKIKIVGDDDYYEGWRLNGRLQYRQEGNYIRAYIYIKKV